MCSGERQIRQALDAHPRIGERAPGTGREAAWSATEQSGMDSATADVKAALIEANRAYEDRFGRDETATAMASPLVEWFERPLPRPGAIRRITQAGRSTFYCPVCQR